MNRLAPAALILGLACTAPIKAHAAEFLVSYSGFVTDADADNMFGVSPDVLVGAAIRADVRYTTSVPRTRTTTATSDEVFGGQGFGTAPVISSVLFTVGTQTFSFSPTYYTDVYVSTGYADAYGYDISGNSFQTYIFPNMTTPLSLDTPFISTGTGDEGGRRDQFSYVADGQSVVDFDATRIAVSAAPEPSAWLLMSLGIGGAGFLLRRRWRGGPVTA